MASLTNTLLIRKRLGHAGVNTVHGGLRSFCGRQDLQRKRMFRVAKDEYIMIPFGGSPYEARRRKFTKATNIGAVLLRIQRQARIPTPPRTLNSRAAAHKHIKTSYAGAPCNHSGSSQLSHTCIFPRFWFDSVFSVLYYLTSSRLSALCICSPNGGASRPVTSH